MVEIVVGHDHRQCLPAAGQRIVVASYASLYAKAVRHLPIQCAAELLSIQVVWIARVIAAEQLQRRLVVQLIVQGGIQRQGMSVKEFHIQLCGGQVAQQDQPVVQFVMHTYTALVDAADAG